MKDFIKNFIILSLMLISSIHSIEPKNKTEIYIPTIKFNGMSTSTFGFLDNSDYYYFSFDFEKKNRLLINNTSYFYISTEQQYFINSPLPDSIVHTFIDIDADKISYSYIKEEEKNLIWKRSKMLYKSIPLSASNFTYYYFKITRDKELKNKKTLIIKIPLRKKTLFLRIQHIQEIPENIKKVVEAPMKQIKKDINEDINETIKRINEDKKYDNDNYNPSNRNRYIRYRNINKFDDIIINGNLMTVLFGGILYTIWMALFMLYFLVNRRKKSVIVSPNNYYKEDTSIIYHNI